MLDYGIKCTCRDFTNIIFMSVFEWQYDPKLREMVLPLFRKQNSFNNSRKDGKCGLDWVDYTNVHIIHSRP